MVAKDSDDRVILKEERIKYWLSQGAKPSDRVARFLGQAEIIQLPGRSDQTKQHLPRAKTLERMKEKEEAAAAAAEAATAAEAAAPAEAPVEGGPSRGILSRGSPSRGSLSRGSPSRGSLSRGSPSRGSPSRGGSENGLDRRAQGFCYYGLA